ncbi:MAG: ribonuclease HI family protein [Candidatus Thorarchaeota archaeon]
MKEYKIWFDGAARGNPGQAGAGAIFQDNESKQFNFKKYLGIATNNQAEYQALLIALEQLLTHLKKEGVQEPIVLLIHGDSELIIKQLRGEYKVKNPILKVFYEKVQTLLKSFKSINDRNKIDFFHIPREINKKADELANKAIDERFNRDKSLG